MVLPLLLALQPVGSPPAIVPAIADPTVEELTEPAARYTCEAREPSGRVPRFTIHQSGGRGYRNAQTGRVEQSDKDARVDGDLAGYEWKSYSTLDGSAAAPRARFGQHVKLELPQSSGILTTEQPGRVGVILHRMWEWMPLVQAVGFCEVRLMAQAPLTSAEASQLTRTGKPQ